MRPFTFRLYYKYIERYRLSVMNLNLNAHLLGFKAVQTFSTQHRKDSSYLVCSVVICCSRDTMLHAHWTSLYVPCSFNSLINCRFYIKCIFLFKKIYVIYASWLMQFCSSLKFSWFSLYIKSSLFSGTSYKRVFPTNHSHCIHRCCLLMTTITTHTHYPTLTGGVT